MPEPILKTTDLTKSYPSAGAGDLTVLDGIEIEVPAGATCAIVGPSGSGKTTLLGLCAGLDHPTRGDVLLDGQALSGLSEDERAAVRSRSVGFVFQNFQLVPTLTALENVLVPLELRGERGPSLVKRGRELLTEVGLGERTSHFPVQLSGGEQQRVALARAFIGEPKILFADEPTGNLDGDSGALIEEMLFRLNKSKGTTLVIVTHDRELADKADVVFVMKNGRVIDTVLAKA
ncbi:MAG: putative ABC transport system ATP-binding protein [Verrucomicrobiales bacterium]|jgi:putative ABC transport system ATP-binding protein